MSWRRRWSVDEEGTEPDYRFTLANERTFLAWARTALGLLAGGVAVHQLSEPLAITGGRRFLAIVAIASSVVLGGGGYLRWVAIQRAVRRGDRLPPTRLVAAVAVIVVVLAASAFVLVAFE
jgi:putative membrane protein